MTFPSHPLPANGTERAALAPPIVQAPPGTYDLATVGVIRASGPDAAAFLQGQFTNDVTALDVGSSQYSAWCSPKGRMLANFVVSRVEPAIYELLLDASLVPSIRKRLAMYVLRAKVVVDDVTTALVRLGVGGDAASSVIASITSAVPSTHRSVPIEGGRVIGVPGSRFLVVVAPEHAGALQQRLMPSAPAADIDLWRLLTIRAGIPVITLATTDAFVPQTANWDVLGGVNFQKGCYAGQEIVARTQYLGRLKERLFLMHTEAASVTSGDRIFSAAFVGQASGTVVNAAPVATGGFDVLAVMQLTAAASGDIRVGIADGPGATLRALPYAIPEPAAPRGRIA